MYYFDIYQRIHRQWRRRHIIIIWLHLPCARSAAAWISTHLTVKARIEFDGWVRKKKNANIFAWDNFICCAAFFTHVRVFSSAVAFVCGCSFRFFFHRILRVFFYFLLRVFTQRNGKIIVTIVAAFEIIAAATAKITTKTTKATTATIATATKTTKIWKEKKKSKIKNTTTTITTKITKSAKIILQDAGNR